MGDKTGIEWTDATWNPVTGCTKVSQGCKHCYAERVFPRPYPGRKFTDVRCHPERLDVPLRWKRPRRIFVNSMSDLFHEDVPYDFIAAVFAVMGDAPRHVFQILTKRPERMREWFPLPSVRPLPNVWLGVSCEDQATADERIPLLLQTPAAVRWISAEPLLGPVGVGAYLSRSNMPGLRLMPGFRDPLPGVDWVVVGGESGPGARPFHVAWARSIVAQCRAAGVPVHVKQLGSNPRGWCAWNIPETIGSAECARLRAAGDDGECGNYEGHEQARPCESYGRRCVMLCDRKGGDMSEWPADLRVREYPA